MDKMSAIKKIKALMDEEWKAIAKNSSQKTAQEQQAYTRAAGKLRAYSDSIKIIKEECIS